MTRWKLHRVIPGQTDIWMSVEVINAWTDYLDKIESERRRNIKPKGDRHLVLGKLQYYAQAGFINHEGKNGEPIKPEFGIYRIGHVGSLYRVYGTYESPSKKAFYAVEVLQKKKKKLSGRERDFIEQVAEDLKKERFIKNENAR